MVLIGVNPEEDDLDQDATGEKRIYHDKTTNTNKIGHNKHDKSCKIKNRVITQESNKTLKIPCTPKTPCKNKVTVASRLVNSSLNSPILKQATDTDNVAINLGTEPLQSGKITQAQRDLEAAEQMLIHAQCEAERARRRIR